MATSARVSDLRNRHRALDDAIAEEVKRPHPDDDRLRTLKRDKLRVKDLMVAAEAMQPRAGGAHLTA